MEYQQRQKNLRMKNAKGGFIISTAPYKEEIFTTLDDAIRFIRRYFDTNYDKPRRESERNDRGKAD